MVKAHHHWSIWNSYRRRSTHDTSLLLNRGSNRFFLLTRPHWLTRDLLHHPPSLPRAPIMDGPLVGAKRGDHRERFHLILGRRGFLDLRQRRLSLGRQARGTEDQEVPVTLSLTAVKVPKKASIGPEERPFDSIHTGSANADPGKASRFRPWTRENICPWVLLGVAGLKLTHVCRVVWRWS